MVKLPKPFQAESEDAAVSLEGEYRWVNPGEVLQSDDEFLLLCGWTKIEEEGFVCEHPRVYRRLTKPAENNFEKSDS